MRALALASPQPYERVRKPLRQKREKHGGLEERLLHSLSTRERRPKTSLKDE